MKNIINFLQMHVWKVTTGIFLFLFIMKGCTSTKISNLDKKYSENTLKIENKLDSLQNAVASMATAKEVRDEMELTMFNYLIYEDDLDKGKSSLSDVKNKIEAND